MALSDEITTYAKGFRWDKTDPEQRKAKNKEDSARSKLKKALIRVQKLEQKLEKRIAEQDSINGEVCNQDSTNQVVCNTNLNPSFNDQNFNHDITRPVNH